MLCLRHNIFYLFPILSFQLNALLNKWIANEYRCSSVLQSMTIAITVFPFLFADAIKHLPAFFVVPVFMPVAEG